MTESNARRLADELVREGYQCDVSGDGVVTVLVDSDDRISIVSDTLDELAPAPYRAEIVDAGEIRVRLD